MQQGPVSVHGGGTVTAAVLFLQKASVSAVPVVQV